MIKSVASTVSKIKDKCEEVADQMRGIKEDIDDMKDCIERMKKEVEEESLIELGKKCRSAGKSSIKDCYECAYELIKAPKSAAGSGGAGKEAGGGCCSTF